MYSVVIFSQKYSWEEDVRITPKCTSATLSFYTWSWSHCDRQHFALAMTFQLLLDIEDGVKTLKILHALDLLHFPPVLKYLLDHRQIQRIRCIWTKPVQPDPHVVSKNAQTAGFYQSSSLTEFLLRLYTTWYGNTNILKGTIRQTMSVQLV